MKNISKLLAALDEITDVPNRISSEVEELSRYYDDKTSEYVFAYRYRAKAAPGARPVKPCKVKPLIDFVLDRRSKFDSHEAVGPQSYVRDQKRHRF